jgi:hypothetical protein
MPNREMKTYTAPLSFKADGAQGSFQAVFATLDVEDLDGDVTLPGAFGSQRVLIEAWNHDMDVLPVGKGVIGESDARAVVDGQFFLDTAAGKDHYTVVKELGDQQEWSYTFYVREAEPGVRDGHSVRLLKKLEVLGVAPVTKGAGIDTHTTAIKNAKGTDAGNGDGDTGDGDKGEAGTRKLSDLNLLAWLDMLEMSTILENARS